MTTMAAVLWDMPGVTDVHSSLDVYTHLFLCFLYSDRPNWLLLFICLPLHTASAGRIAFSASFMTCISSQVASLNH
jgi:hypothetical protein